MLGGSSTIDDLGPNILPIVDLESGRKEIGEWPLMGNRRRNAG